MLGTSGIDSANPRKPSEVALSAVRNKGALSPSLFLRNSFLAIRLEGFASPKQICRMPSSFGRHVPPVVARITAICSSPTPHRMKSV